MKKKIVDVLVFLFFMALLGITGYLFFENDRLNTLISEQNSFIKEVTGKDSVFLNESKKYQDTLKTYTEKISWHLNGKELNSNQFIDAYYELESKKDSIQTLLDYARGTYKFNVFSKRKGNKTTLTTGNKFSTADSAQMALYFFGDRLVKNKDGSWSADQTSKIDLENSEKRIKVYKDAMEQNSALTDSLIKRMKSIQ